MTFYSDVVDALTAAGIVPVTPGDDSLGDVSVIPAGVELVGGGMRQVVEVLVIGGEMLDFGAGEDMQERYAEVSALLWDTHFIVVTGAVALGTPTGSGGDPVWFGSIRVAHA